MNKNIIIINGMFEVIDHNGDALEFQQPILSAIFQRKPHHCTVVTSDVDEEGTKYSVSFDSGVNIVPDMDMINFRLTVYIPSQDTYYVLETESLMPKDFMEEIFDQNLIFQIPESIDNSAYGCVSPLADMFDPCVTAQGPNQHEYCIPEIYELAEPVKINPDISLEYLSTTDGIRITITPQENYPITNISMDLDWIILDTDAPPRNYNNYEIITGISFRDSYINIDYEMATGGNLNDTLDIKVSHLDVVKKHSCLINTQVSIIGFGDVQSMETDADMCTTLTTGPKLVGDNGEFGQWYLENESGSYLYYDLHPGVNYISLPLMSLDGSGDIGDFLYPGDGQTFVPVNADGWGQEVLCKPIIGSGISAQCSLDNGWTGSYDYIWGDNMGDAFRHGMQISLDETSDSYQFRLLGKIGSQQFTDVNYDTDYDMSYNYVGYSAIGLDDPCNTYNEDKCNRLPDSCEYIENDGLCVSKEDVEIYNNLKYLYPVDENGGSQYPKNMQKSPTLFRAPPTESPQDFSSFRPPCKEYLYQPMNTLETFFQEGPDSNPHKNDWRLRLDAIIQEGKLINAVDYSGDGVNNGWLGTLVELDSKQSQWMVQRSGYGGGNYSPFLDSSYDTCFVCSGGDTGHEFNSDLDEFAFGKIKAGTFDEMVDCCYFPYEVTTYYEQLRPGENYGRTWLDSKQICTSNGDGPIAFYDAEECVDSTEVASSGQDCETVIGAVGCDYEIVTDILVSYYCPFSCNTCDEYADKNYFRVGSDCFEDETQDILGNCIGPGETGAVVDKEGTACLQGSIDLCGICYGSSDCTIVGQCPPGIEPVVNIEVLDLSGVDTPIQPGEQGEILISLMTNTNVSEFSFDISSINPKSLTDGVPIIEIRDTNGYEISDFEIFTTPFTSGNNTHINVGGFATTRESALTPNTYFITIRFDNFMYGDVVEITNATAGYNQWSADFINILTQPITIPDIMGCYDPNASNFSNVYTMDCAGTPVLQCYGLGSCSQLCCEYSLQSFPFINILEQYYTGSQEPVYNPSNLQGFLQQYDVNDLVSNFGMLFHPRGNFLNSRWALRHYRLYPNPPSHNDFDFLYNIYYGSHNHAAYPGHHYEDLDDWLWSNFEDDGFETTLDGLIENYFTDEWCRSTYPNSCYQFPPDSDNFSWLDTFYQFPTTEEYNDYHFNDGYTDWDSLDSWINNNWTNYTDLYNTARAHFGINYCKLGGDHLDVEYTWSEADLGCTGIETDNFSFLHSFFHGDPDYFDYENEFEFSFTDGETEAEYEDLGDWLLHNYGPDAGENSDLLLSQLDEVFHIYGGSKSPTYKFNHPYLSPAASGGQGHFNQNMFTVVTDRELSVDRHVDSVPEDGTCLYDFMYSENPDTYADNNCDGMWSENCRLEMVAAGLLWNGGEVEYDDSEQVGDEFLSWTRGENDGLARSFLYLGPEAGWVINGDIEGFSDTYGDDAFGNISTNGYCSSSTTICLTNGISLMFLNTAGNQRSGYIKFT